MSIDRVDSNVPISGGSEPSLPFQNNIQDLLHNVGEGIAVCLDNKFPDSLGANAYLTFGQLQTIGNFLSAAGETTSSPLGRSCAVLVSAFKNVISTATSWNQISPEILNTMATCAQTLQADAGSFTLNSTQFNEAMQHILSGSLESINDYENTPSNPNDILNTLLGNFGSLTQIAAIDNSSCSTLLNTILDLLQEQQNNPSENLQACLHSIEDSVNTWIDTYYPDTR